MSTLREDAVQVYLYGYSAMMTEAIHRGSDDKGFEHLRSFPDERYHRITALNMDTLYSYAWTQLAYTPYIIHIPKIEERYVLFPIMDAYGEVIYSLGTRTPDFFEGDYILLYKDEPVPMGYEGYRVLRSEDSMNSVLLRIETRGPEDYPVVSGIQDRITIHPMYPERVKKVRPALEISPRAHLDALEATRYYQEYAELTRYNAIKDEKILAAFERLGYDAAQASLDLTAITKEQKEAFVYGKQEALKQMAASTRSPEAVSEQNQWVTQLSEIGVFGDKYLQRAACAKSGWGGNIVDDTLYSISEKDIGGERLSADRKYRLHIKADGYPHAAVFWSITLYGEKHHFPVQNEINRFSVNNYDIDAGRVEKNPDGSLDLYISAQRPEDVHEAKNWLPAPADEKYFWLAIRNYWPDQMSKEGLWEPPVISRM